MTTPAAAAYEATVCAHEETEGWCYACGKSVNRDYGCFSCGGGRAFSQHCLSCDATQYQEGAEWEL